jgi:hypothetical protein
MSQQFHYMFKKGLTGFGESATFTKQLAVNNIVVDLRNGEIYLVTSITSGNEHKPDVVQTSPLKKFDELGLSSLREEHNFPEVDSEWYYVILSEQLIAKFDRLLADLR